MEQQMLEIISKFKYTTDLPIEELIRTATEKLEIKYSKVSDNTYIIITKSVKEIIDSTRKLETDDYIPTDCRFFAMLVASIKEFPDSGTLFTMQINNDGIEIEVPKTCLYITLDSDKFVLKSTTGDELTKVTAILEDNQGQWITRIDEINYIGIVKEGHIIQNLEKWITRYRDNVVKHIEENEKNDENEKNNRINNSHSHSHSNIFKKSYNGLLRTLVKIHGVCISAYQFNCYSDKYPIVDILKEYPNRNIIPPPLQFCDKTHIEIQNSEITALS